MLLALLEPSSQPNTSSRQWQAMRKSPEETRVSLFTTVSTSRDLGGAADHVELETVDKNGRIRPLLDKVCSSACARPPSLRLSVIGYRGMSRPLACDWGQFDRNSGCEHPDSMSGSTLIISRQTCHSGSIFNLLYKVTFENGQATYESMPAPSVEMPGHTVRETSSLFTLHTP